ncbi:hypothetical protein SFUMM280S_06076 [Streptomyces fumanus]
MPIQQSDVQYTAVATAENGRDGHAWPPTTAGST